MTPPRATKDPKTGKLRERDWSVSLPETFWNNGWPLALSAPGLAVLLIMLDLQRPTQPTTWIAPDRARTLYGVSEDTRHRGIAEPEAQGVLSISKEPVSPREFAWSRVRNTYALNTARLRGQPLWADRAEPG